MATYGARYSRWAPWAEGFEDTDRTKLPRYGETAEIGQLNKVNDSLNFNEGSMPGDDQIVLYEKNFKDGTVDVESVFIPISTAAVAELVRESYHRAEAAREVRHERLADGDDDKAPYGGYGFITNHVSKAKRYFQAIFYPKVKAAPTSGSFDTRGDNINFVTDKMSFHLESPACRKYRVKKDFDAEEAAMAYLDGCFKGTSAIPGLPAPAEPAQQGGNDNTGT